jgi:FxsC-like protein
MFPIVWIPCHHVPESVKSIQLDENFDHMYLQEGLREIIRQKKQHIYDRVLKKIAVRIVRSVELRNLPEINNLPVLKDITNPFVPSKSIDQEFEAKGPSYASFIYISAKKSEIRKVKTNSEAYGKEGGWDWKPYFPKIDKEIAFIVQSVSSDVKIRCEHVSSNANPLSVVENAFKDNNIVILIIDPWSLKLQDYANKASDYDAHEYLNCAVMVSYNSYDLETIRSKENLKGVVQSVFIHKSAIMNPETFKPNISSYEETSIVLSETLQKIQSKLIHASKIKKHISGNGLKMKPLL